jgi:hypothetical protein
MIVKDEQELFPGRAGDAQIAYQLGWRVESYVIPTGRDSYYIVANPEGLRIGQEYRNEIEAWEHGPFFFWTTNEPMALSLIKERRFTIEHSPEGLIHNKDAVHRVVIYSLRGTLDSVAEGNDLAYTICRAWWYAVKGFTGADRLKT